MKRSEALKQIRDILLSERQREDFECQILEVVEKIGMKPPENMKSPECSHCSRSDYSWEPEDE